MEWDKHIHIYLGQGGPKLIGMRQTYSHIYLGQGGPKLIGMRQTYKTLSCTRVSSWINVTICYFLNVDDKIFILPKLQLVKFKYDIGKPTFILFKILCQHVPYIIIRKMYYNRIDSFNDRCHMVLTIFYWLSD